MRSLTHFPVCRTFLFNAGLFNAGLFNAGLFNAGLFNADPCLTVRGLRLGSVV
jgi:hypothetical protein